MDADGSNVTRLTNAPPISDSAPEWSPDGTRMIFETNTGIGIINLDGTERAQIGPGRFPSWSPDGSRIVFSDPSSLHVYTMKPNGTEMTQLTFGDPNDQYPSFSPDGKKIVFARNTSGTMGLWTMNADGSGQVIFSGTNTIGSGYPDWQRAPNTTIGAASLLRIDEAAITFANVLTEGNTTLTPITPTAAQIPPGFALCPTCPSYDVVTTATYAPPVTVCLQVPAITSPASFNTLRLFHSEGGILIDRTISRHFPSRRICAQTTSLSPFVVAAQLAPTAANVSVGGRVSDANGAGISKVQVLLTDQHGVGRSAMTNPFGYFRFDDVEAGHMYVVSVSSKRFQFENNVQTLHVVDEVANIQFIALP
jgi:hypothetical protein